jgi:DNA-binding GntR family transcriptional regulator
MAWWTLVVSTVSAMGIDATSFEPVYRQLARILREQIQAGGLEAGQPVGSEASLSQRFGVGRDAVRDPLALLRSEGLVVTTRGIGTFVRGPVEDLAVVRVGAGTRVSARVPTADERLSLGIPEGTAVLIITKAGEQARLLPADRTVVEFENG